MAEAVVDRLEVVEVDQEDADRPLRAGAAHERMLEPVAEQGPVGEPAGHAGQST